MRDKPIRNENLQAPELAAMQHRAGVVDYTSAVAMNVLYREFASVWTPPAETYNATVASAEIIDSNMTPPTESFSPTAAASGQEQRILAAQQATREAFNEPAA